MPIHYKVDINDERLDAFRNIRHRNFTRMSGLFIAEGKLLVDRLLASNLEIKSIFCDAKSLARIESRLTDDTEVYLLDDDAIESLVGFDFHRGLMACGVRPREIPFQRWVSELSQAQSENDPRAQASDTGASDTGAVTSIPATILVAVAVQDPENLGGILRSCAGLGIQNVLLGPECCDPFSRRVLRVSMGTVMKLNLIQVPNVAVALAALKQKLGFHSVATSLAADSVELQKANRPRHLAILMGNEAHGLPPNIQNAADQRVKIDMELGTDSLNVSVAAGIVMHYFTRLAARK